MKRAVVTAGLHPYILGSAVSVPSLSAAEILRVQKLGSKPTDNTDEDVPRAIYPREEGPSFSERNMKIPSVQSNRGSAGEEEKAEPDPPNARLARGKGAVQPGPVPLVRGRDQLPERVGHHLPGAGLCPADRHHP